jgi:integrase
VAITLGLRPGELRKLTWDLLDLNRGVVHVWRSASKSGDTKTPQSKRSLVLPKRAITALKATKTCKTASAWRREEAGREAPTTPPPGVQLPSPSVGLA